MNNFKAQIYKTQTEVVVSSSYSFSGSCGTGIPTRTYFTPTTINDACTFQLVVTGGSVAMRASSFKNSGSILDTQLDIVGIGSSLAVNHSTASDITTLGSILTIQPGTYTGTFSWNYQASQGVATIVIN